MKAFLKLILIIALGSSIGCVSATTATNKDSSTITTQELRSILDDPDVVILDVRPEQQWRTSELKIRGAVYENPKKVGSWAGKYSKDKMLILY